MLHHILQILWKYFINRVTDCDGKEKNTPQSSELEEKYHVLVLSQTVSGKGVESSKSFNLLIHKIARPYFKDQIK